ncbi:hypothetical protein [Mesorhizobium sp.]|uniref:hypothetical protein n=1 Tax=Mesorhizobium sp. TaxID=1871066 RepID=UPI00257FE83A|nr:hypothetical protein [Mesorhizobium sp.]
MSVLIDALRQSNQQNLLRATIIAAIITTAVTPDSHPDCRDLSSKLSRGNDVVEGFWGASSRLLGLDRLGSQMGWAKQATGVPAERRGDRPLAPDAEAQHAWKPRWVVPEHGGASKYAPSLTGVSRCPAAWKSTLS